MIFHIIRTNRNVSLFKEIIQHCLHSNLGDEMFISSGFFQESVHRGSYSASHDVSSFGDSFMNYRFPQKMTINTKGVYSGYWTADYNKFCDNLRVAGYNVNQFRNHHHHAKVFIYQNNGYPLLEIIGSSNMTSRAYGTTRYFNTETDLVIINNRALGSRIEGLLRDRIDNEGIMKLNYAEDNIRSLRDEMIWIRDSLF